MARILLSLGLVLAIVMTMLVSTNAAAAEVPTVKIGLVQAAGSDLKYERVDIVNLGDSSVYLTGWKLVYTSASGATTTPLLQVQAATNWHVILDAGASESVLSKELIATTAVDSPLRLALQFGAALNHTAGGLQLLDASSQVVDMVGWGASAAAAVRLGDAAPAMSSTTWLKRRAVTGDNATDFLLEAQSLSNPMRVGSLYEVFDSCTNLAGIQQGAPDGYSAGSDGTCQLLDLCQNLDGVQAALPAGMEFDTAGDCQPIDVCRNIEGRQAVVPAGYEQTMLGQCELLLPVRNIIISELLPNPTGADTGNEFIELYNGDSEPVALDNYRLAIGDKVYVLPAGVVIAPGAYWTLSDTDLGGVLANTTGQPLYLLTIRGVEVAQVPGYKNAGDDMAWALIDGQWQFTYAPTPGRMNVALVEMPCDLGYERDSATGRCRKLATATQVAPCVDGQYRNEATGRCRSLATAIATLTPCKEGQYRSEATNRCRSFVVATTSKPCADDQFRNPLTNRCKAIASNEDVALADCGEGRERNPDTHRCRNVVTASVPSAAFAPAPVKETARGFVGWWALGGVGLLAAGYGVWEWRREIAAIGHRLASVVRSK